MTGIAEVREEIRQISALADAVRRLVADGRAVELGRIEARIDGCCAAIRDLPRADAAAILPSLTALLDELGRLERTVRKAHGEIAEQLGQAGARRRAVAAYGAVGQDGER